MLVGSSAFVGEHTLPTPSRGASRFQASFYFGTNREIIRREVAISYRIVNDEKAKLKLLLQTRITRSDSGISVVHLELQELSATQHL